MGPHHVSSLIFGPHTSHWGFAAITNNILGPSLYPYNLPSYLHAFPSLIKIQNQESHQAFLCHQGTVEH